MRHLWQITQKIRDVYRGWAVPHLADGGQSQGFWRSATAALTKQPYSIFQLPGYTQFQQEKTHYAD